MEAPSSATGAQNNNSRPLAHFAPSPWSHTFDSFSFPELEFEALSEQVEMLKGKVRERLIASGRDLVENIEVINLLCRLGVSYHFETEMEDQLDNAFKLLCDQLHQNNDHGYDLYTTALLFRIFRQEGYNMPCEMFKKFMDGHGKFKESIKDDVKGILSLYEATFISFPEEDILDEALSFTEATLKSIIASGSISPPLAEHIKHALTHPFWRCVPRLAAREYISFYQENESRDETLLRFAKLDFNRLQLLHRQELATLSRWWKDLKVMEELPYVRDRLVEGYAWANATHFEPQNGLSRIMYTKYILLMTILDDTYDAYGTYDELQLFSAAFLRGNTEDIDKLPDYMKFIFKVYLNLVEETENVVSKQGREYGAYYVKETLKQLVGGYKEGSEWLNNAFMPPFEEYLRNGMETSTCPPLLAATFLGKAKVAGIKENEWLLSDPKVVKAGSLIVRLLNDKTGHKDERKRDHIPSAVECLVKEYGISEAKAIEKMEEMVATAWKQMNQGSMMPSVMPRCLLIHNINLTRMTYFTYDDRDRYTNPIHMKEHVTSLLLHPIPT